MNASTILRELAARDISVTVTADGQHLRYDAPEGAVTPDVLDQLRAHKPEIIALLSDCCAAGHRSLSSRLLLRHR